MTHGNPKEPHLDVCSRTVKGLQLSQLQLSLCTLPWSSCTSLCGREVFLWIWEHWNMAVQPVAPWGPSVGLTGVCKWEHLLWSWWSMVHYHTEPGSEWWHWSTMVYEGTTQPWWYWSRGTGDIHSVTNTVVSNCFIKWIIFHFCTSLMTAHIHPI